MLVSKMTCKKRNVKKNVLLPLPLPLPLPTTKSTPPRWLRFSLLLLLLFFFVHKGSNLPVILVVVEAKTAPPRCLYSILGVPKQCSASELKKAYRRAALRVHPDKQGGNEEKFKQLSHAYQVLSNPEQRERYDRYGYAGIQPNGGGGGAAPAATSFSSYPFGQQQQHQQTQSQQYPFGSAGTRRQEQQQQQSSHFSFRTTTTNGGSHVFSDFYSMFGDFAQGRPSNRGSAWSSSSSFGLEDWIRHMMSGGAAGGGAASNNPRGGSTRYQPNRPLKEVTRTLECTLADLFVGKTKTVALQIRLPGGGGPGGGSPLDHDQQQQQQQTYTIKLKPGWKTGTKIKFPQRGPKVPPITFVIQEVKHATLERRGNDLVYRKKVYPSRRRKNGHDKPVQLHITLPDGQVWQRTVPPERVPRLLKPGNSLTVPDMGMPIKDTNERGNLIIEFY